MRTGALSQFYNLSPVYNLLLVPQAVNISAAINTTYNRAGGEEFIIVGPTVGVKAKVFKQTVTTGCSASYNVSYTNGDPQTKVLNLRWNAAYMLLKKHNLSANAIWQQRHMLERPQTHSLTATLAYAYSF